MTIHENSELLSRSSPFFVHQNYGHPYSSDDLSNDEAKANPVDDDLSHHYVGLQSQLKHIRQNNKYA